MNLTDYAKFLDRCRDNPEYNITFYVLDDETAESVFNTITGHFNGNGIIKEVSLNGNTAIKLNNNSLIRIVSTQHMVPCILSHIIFMDSRIREKYIKEEIKPTIDQYVTGENSAMLNPKPIYFKYENGGN